MLSVGDNLTSFTGSEVRTHILYYVCMPACPPHDWNYSRKNIRLHLVRETRPSYYDTSLLNNKKKCSLQNKTNLKLNSRNKTQL